MKTIRNLMEYIKIGGDKALSEQSNVSRDYKNDGSIVTHIDKELNSYLSEVITRLYPDANLVTEEAESEYNPEREYSFAVDPIDGTDSFSQGMPGWCVSVGLLKGKQPVAGIVYAPSWGVSGGNMIFSDIDGSVEINGRKVEYTDNPLDSENYQIMAGSGLHRYCDLNNFKGKIRAAGSSVINIVSPLIHSSVKASLITQCYIWDIAAAHAIIKKYGLRADYYNGSAIDYTPLLERKLTSDFIVTGYDAYCKNIRETIFIKK